MYCRLLKARVKELSENCDPSRAVNMVSYNKKISKARCCFRTCKKNEFWVTFWTSSWCWMEQLCRVVWCLCSSLCSCASWLMIWSTYGQYWTAYLRSWTGQGFGSGHGTWLGKTSFRTHFPPSCSTQRPHWTKRLARLLTLSLGR